MPHMPIGTPYGAELPTLAESEPGERCAFILDAGTSATGETTCCAASPRLGSVYCHEHHALCYLPSRSLAERRKLKEIEALAKAVGGRSGRPARRPSPGFLNRMDRVSRGILQPNRSRTVLIGTGDRGVNRGETR
jgi:hypothetical protein